MFLTIIITVLVTIYTMVVMVMGAGLCVSRKENINPQLQWYLSFQIMFVLTWPISIPIWYWFED